MTEPKTVEIVNGLMDVEQVARYLNIPKSSVYSLTFRNKIPCIRLGGKRLRFKQDAIDKWLDGQEGGNGNL